MADHVATPGSREMTVHKGQQVEILELMGGSSEMCLIRLHSSSSMSSSGGGSELQPEGLPSRFSNRSPTPDLGLVSVIRRTVSSKHLTLSSCRGCFLLEQNNPAFLLHSIAKKSKQKSLHRKQSVASTLFRQATTFHGESSGE